VRNGIDLGRVKLILKGLRSKKHFTINVKTTIFTPYLNIEQQTPQKTSKEEFDNLLLVTPMPATLFTTF